MSPDPPLDSRPDAAPSEPDTSSIGPTWPPRLSSHQRIKGIDDRAPIDDRAALDALLEALESEFHRLRPGGPTRLSLRAVVDSSLLAEPALAAWAEAALPLGGRHAGRSLLYLGRNHATRQPAAVDLARGHRNLEIAATEARRSAAAVTARGRSHGYRFDVLGADERLADNALLDGVALLYRRFGWTRDDVRRMLEPGTTLLGVARRGDRVACAGLAELSRLGFEESDAPPLVLAELTEAATHENHLRRGLYSAVCGSLMLELAKRSKAHDLLGGPLDLAFGECSGLEGGVLVAAVRLGRRFAARVDLPGLPKLPGYLPQHASIEGAQRSAAYNDLFPSFISGEALERWARGD